LRTENNGKYSSLSPTKIAIGILRRACGTARNSAEVRHAPACTAVAANSCDSNIDNVSE